MNSGGKRIEHYGLIRNMLSAALVSRDGSIDWLCLPRFDSAACFAALLGGREHGHWSIAAAGGVERATRRYLPDTAVLEATFATDNGEVTLADFMPLSENESKVDVVRIVRGVRGEVELRRGRSNGGGSGASTAASTASTMRGRKR